MRLVLIAMMAALSASPALAQQTAAPAPACAAMDTKLPADLADWNGKGGLASATGASDIGKSSVTLSKGYEVALLNTPRISYPVQPEKPGGSVAYGGLFEVTVEIAGSYTVALGAPAWIDLIENGKTIRPTSFNQGVPCTSIRKTVVFPLQAGKHVLQVSANAEPKLKIMVVRKP